MNVKLEVAELAYLLHTLGAEKVVGVDNARFFPDEPSARETLLNDGFEKLKKHNWFIETDEGINANDNLMLMAAVAAAPSFVFTAKHFTEDNAYQNVTYYIAEEIIIEQFLAADGNYLLTRLDSVATMAGRLQEMYNSLGNTSLYRLSLAFSADGFEKSLRQAKSGDMRALKASLLQNGVPKADLDSVAGNISQLRPTGQIEGAAILDKKVQKWQEVVIFTDNNNALWLGYSSDKADLFHLAVVYDDNFKKYLERFLDSVMSDD